MSGVQKGERKDTLESVFQHFSGLGQPPDPHGPGLWMEELGKNWASRHVLFHAHHPQPTKYQSGLRRRWKKENEKMNKRRAYPSWCKWRSPSKIHMDEENIWQLFEQSNQKKTNKQTKREEKGWREKKWKRYTVSLDFQHPPATSHCAPHGPSSPGYVLPMHCCVAAHHPHPISVLLKIGPKRSPFCRHR